MLLFTISDEIKPQTVVATITEHPAVHCMEVIRAPSAKSTIRPATPEEAEKFAGGNYMRIVLLSADLNANRQSQPAAGESRHLSAELRTARCSAP
jgi:hypothetical protein